MCFCFQFSLIWFGWREVFQYNCDAGWPQFLRREFASLILPLATFSLLMAFSSSAISGLSLFFFSQAAMRLSRSAFTAFDSDVGNFEKCWFENCAQKCCRGNKKGEGGGEAENGDFAFLFLRFCYLKCAVVSLPCPLISRLTWPNFLIH